MAAKRTNKTETPEAEAPQQEAQAPARTRKRATTASAPDGKAAPKKSAPKKKTASQSADPTPEEISRRAYELYEQRGGEHGRHEDDWHQAERELRGSKSKE